MEEGLSNMQIAILKKEYAPFKGKTITAARAKQLLNILDKFKDDDLKKLAKETIPFVSSGARSKLVTRNMKFKVTNVNPFKEEVTQEDFDLEEGKMKTIATMFSQGKSAEEIAKAMKLPVDTVKNILGENAPSTADIDRLKKQGMKPKKEDLDEKIQPFMISYSKYGKHAGFEDAKSLQDLQTKAQKLRAKGFTIDKMGRYNPPVKMKAGYGESVDNYPTSDINKKKHAAYQDPSKGEKKPIEIGTKMKNEEMRLRIEAIAGLKKKAEKSGMPYSILKKVYDRGMAAWKGGHRPGAGQHQWAFARVNSFVTKSSGTWGGADKDLAAKVRGSKK